MRRDGRNISMMAAALTMLLLPAMGLAQASGAEPRRDAGTTARGEARGEAQAQGQSPRQAEPRAPSRDEAQGKPSAQGQAHGQAQAGTPQARIDAALQAAARAEVPLELVKSKVAEGEAKRVPPERIAAAVEARVASLVRASETMDRAGLEARTAGELAVIADALDAKVSESALIRIARESPPERRAVAIAVLADLVRLGSASEQALLRVSAAVTSSTALANLHAEVASQLRLGGLHSTLDATGIIRIP